MIGNSWYSSLYQGGIFRRIQAGDSVIYINQFGVALTAIAATNRQFTKSARATGPLVLPNSSKQTTPFGTGRLIAAAHLLTSE